MSKNELLKRIPIKRNRFRKDRTRMRFRFHAFCRISCAEPVSTSAGNALVRERPDATNGRTSGNETTRTARVLRHDELDAVSGGLNNFRIEIGSLPCAFDSSKNEVSYD